MCALYGNVIFLLTKIKSITYPINCILVTIKNDLCMHFVIITLPLLGNCMSANAFGHLFGLWGTTIATTQCVSSSFIFSLIVFFSIECLGEKLFVHNFLSRTNNFGHQIQTPPLLLKFGRWMANIIHDATIKKKTYVV